VDAKYHQATKQYQNFQEYQHCIAKQQFHYDLIIKNIVKILSVV